MPRLSAFAAPLALAVMFVPGIVGAESGGTMDGAVAANGQDAARIAAAQQAGWRGVFNPLRIFHQRQSANQVRIEQRVVVRISPQPMSARQELAAQAFERQLTNRYLEKKIGKCLPLEGISAVQTGSGNRLVLYLRDRSMVSVSLEKSCHARDFYSGFYVERHKDGRLCVDRDQLQSRTGVKCEVQRLHRLVEIKR